MGKVTTGLGFTEIVTAAELWHLFVLVTVTEAVLDDVGFKVTEGVVLPVLHLKVWEEALSLVSSVREFA